MKDSLSSTSRRAFVGKLALGAAAGMTTLSGLSNPAKASIPGTGNISDAEAWFRRARGTHRVVFDATEQHEGLPFIWPWVFYVTNNESGVSDADITAMVVMRHNAIPFAMEDRIWQKYKLGEFFKIIDNKTNKPATRNPYYIPQEGDLESPEVQGIQEMQERGAMFCVCNMALKFYSSMLASNAKLSAEEVYNDWLSGILEGIQVVPSGVWAIGRAQEHRFGYCYAGG